MNLPNKLTVLRMCLVPAIIFVLLLPVSNITSVVGAFIFLAASLTDMLDGKLARKYGLVTDFGKFMDPLADKLMVIAALMCIVMRSHDVPLIFYIFAPLTMIITFRELAVTSIRLVAIKNANIVVAANMHGKVKTVTQIVCIMSALLEPILAQISFLSFLSYYPITIVAAAVTLFMTIWSGWIYLSTYWKYLDQNK